MDEGRFGLKNWFHRRWCPKGIRPPWIVNDRYESFWLYAAVEPTTGTGYFLLLSEITGECLELFLQHFRSEVEAETIGMVLDSSGSHQSKQVSWPPGMKPLYLPSYCPELNPVEQIFRHLRKRLSNTMFTDLDALQTALMEELQRFWANPTILLHLTNYPWWAEGTQTILSLSP